jgi:hypothetical protein
MACYVPQHDALKICKEAMTTQISAEASDLPVELIQDCYRSDLAFPDLQYIPAVGLQQRFDAFISRDIRRELRCPEFVPRARHGGESAAGMPVPEATVYEQHCSCRWKDEVRPTRQSAVVDKEAKSCSVKIPSDTQFRPRRLTPDPCHHPRAHLWSDCVNHVSTSSRVRPLSADRCPIDGKSGSGWAGQGQLRA